MHLPAVAPANNASSRKAGAGVCGVKPTLETRVSARGSAARTLGSSRWTFRQTTTLELESSTLACMRGSELDVSTLLRTAYRAPAPDSGLAERVRARVALIDTFGEIARLLVETPVFAFTTTLGAGSEVPEEAPDAGAT